MRLRLSASPRLARILVAAGARPASPQAVYDVPFWLYGRCIATVRVPGTSEEDAVAFAERYLTANLYPHKVTRSDEPLPAGGREIVLAEGDRDMYRADPIGMSAAVAAAEAAPEDSPEGKRVRCARYCFKHWALHTIVSTCRDWGTLSVTEKAIWIDMVAMMEGKI